MPPAHENPIQRRAALWTLVIAVLIWLPAAFLMGRSLLIHNILGG